MQPIWGGAVGEVVMSANSEFKSGDTVLGHMKFSEYVIVPKGEGLQKVDASQAPLSYYLGVLGECCCLLDHFTNSCMIRPGPTSVGISIQHQHVKYITHTMY